MRAPRSSSRHRAAVAATLAELAQADPERRGRGGAGADQAPRGGVAGSAGAAADAFSARQLRGEVVLVIAGASPAPPAGDDDIDIAVRPRWPTTPRRPAPGGRPGRCHPGRAAATGVRGDAARAGHRRRGGLVGPPRARAGTLPAVPPYYLTTPIYYVNDAPHVGHGVHDRQRRRAGPLAPAARRRRVVPDRHRRARRQDRRGGRGTRLTPQEWTDQTSARFVEAWRAPRHHLRRLHPDHRAPALRGGAGVPAAHLRQRVHRARALRGLYCVSCEDYYTEDQLVEGKLPDTRAPRRRDAGGQLLLQAERVRAPAARLVRRAPRLRAPELQAQRGTRVHPRRLARLLDHADLLHLGCPGPVGQRARLLRVVRRAHQLPHRGGLRRRRGGFLSRWGARAPSHRQGHLEVPLRVVAGDVHGRRASSRRPRSSCTASCCWAGRSWASR